MPYPFGNNLKLDIRGGSHDPAITMILSGLPAGLAIDSAQLQAFLDRCHAPYSLDVEDLSDYGEGWNASVLNNSNDFSQAWRYQSQSQRRGYPLWGKLTVYRGGGYVVSLGTDRQSASR